MKEENKELKTLILNGVKGSFTRDDGETVDYMTYYVELYGIQIKLYPIDKAARALLENYYEKGVI
jgi:hypothetical protein